MDLKEKNRPIEMVFKYRIPIIIVMILFTAGIGYFAKYLKLNTGFESMVPEQNPDWLYYKEMEEIFGEMNAITVGISHKDSIYNKETIKLIDEFTSFFENREGLVEDDIISLTTIDNMYADWGELLIDPLVDDAESLDEYALEELREAVEENPMTRDKIVSSDGKSTILVIPVPNNVSEDETTFTTLIDDTFKMAEKLEAAYPDTEIYVSGTSVAEAKTSKYMMKDLTILFPVALGIVMILLLIIMRDIRGMIIPILVTLFSVIWTFGLKGLLGVPITITEITIPVMLIAIGCANGVHIISEFFHFQEKGLTTKEAISKTMSLLTLPVILASLTTSLGFASLLSAPGVSIKNMGIFLAFGVIVAMTFSLLFIPAILSFFANRKIIKKKKRQEKQEQPKIHFATHFFVKWGRAVMKFKYPILGLAAGFIIISVAGILNIESEMDNIKYFYKKDKFYVATKHLEKNMGGICNLQVIIDLEKNDDLKDPAFLEKAVHLQQVLENGQGKKSALAGKAKELRKLIEEPGSTDSMIMKKIEELKSMAGAGENGDDAGETVKEGKDSKESKQENVKPEIAQKIDEFYQAARELDQTAGEPIKDPEMLQKIWDLQKFAEKQELVSYSFSLADYIKRINYLMNENDPAYDRIPKVKEIIERERYEYNEDGEEIVTIETVEVAGRDQINNLIFLYEMGGGDALDDFANHNYTKASIQLRLKETSTLKLRTLVNELNGYIEENFEDPSKVRLTNHYVTMVISDIITQSQLISLTTSLITIAILLAFIFRSLSSGLITVIPTIIAIIFNFAIMWIFQIRLDVGTSIIASIGLGCGVDYSIHYFQRFKLLYKKLGNYEEAAREAILEAGRAILSNAFSVGLGFAVLMFSRFQVIFNLGWMISLSMFTTALNALIILPVLIVVFKPKVK